MKYTLILILSIALFSCNESEKTEENSEKKELGNFKKTEELPTCNCKELVKDTSSNISTLNNEKYTGTCFSYYPNDSTKVMEEIQYLDGKIHGYYRVYSPTDNNILTEDQYKDGVKQASGDIFKCDCDDLLVEEIGAEKAKTYILNGKVFTGICEKYSQDGQMKILDMQFLKGLRHGNSIYYDQYGDPITADVHEEGKFVKTVVYTKNEAGEE
jgi:hypothetical protein